MLQKSLNFNLSLVPRRKFSKIEFEIEGRKSSEGKIWSFCLNYNKNIEIIKCKMIEIKRVRFQHVIDTSLKKEKFQFTHICSGGFTIERVGLQPGASPLRGIFLLQFFSSSLSLGCIFCPNIFKFSCTIFSPLHIMWKTLKNILKLNWVHLPCAA